ncbi:uncharacterized protein LOC143243987 isoform X1 [Tachypleus tridentatus]|uniref:uncharacterized protein LOC143243987 isoform X1 n=2 Tax=Tachypleus tridentatus TaxID=6853 RepID=UPI003FD3D514
MLGLFDVISTSETYSLDLKYQYLEAVDTFQSFSGQSSKNTENVTKEIKDNLKTPEKRTHGLLLLRKFLGQCSSEVFMENSLSWAHSLSLILKNNCIEPKHLACSILSRLLEHLSSFPELWREAAGRIIPSLVETLTHTPSPEEMLDDLTMCLSHCMLIFPGPCGQFKNRIELFLLAHVDKWKFRSPEHLALCFALLPSCGGGGNQGKIHAAAWSEQMDKVLGVMHGILDSLYEQLENDSRKFYDNAHELLNLPPVETDDPVSVAFLSQKRFEVLGFCISKMLSVEFPVTVVVPVNALLNLIYRTCAVNPTILMNRASSSAELVATVLPSLHTSALQILEALILSCRKILVPRSLYINKLFVQELGWSLVNGNWFGRDRPFSSVRKTCYQVISSWLKVLGASSGVDILSEKIWKHMAADIQSEDNILKLQKQSSGSKLAGKQKDKQNKASKKSFDLNQGFGFHRKFSSKANKSVCSEALRALKTLLYAVGCILKPDIHKDIHHKVVHLLHQVQQNPNNPPVPYSDRSCRLELYSVLIAAILSPHSSWPPPLQPAVKIFTKGQQEQDSQVSEFCMSALATCVTILHPQVAIIRPSSISAANSGTIVGHTVPSLVPHRNIPAMNGDPVTTIARSCIFQPSHTRDQKESYNTNISRIVERQEVNSISNLPISSEGHVHFVSEQEKNVGNSQWMRTPISSHMFHVNSKNGDEGLGLTHENGRNTRFHEHVPVQENLHESTPTKSSLHEPVSVEAHQISTVLWENKQTSKINKCTFNQVPVNLRTQTLLPQNTVQNGISQNTRDLVKPVISAVCSASSQNVSSAITMVSQCMEHSENVEVDVGPDNVDVHEIDKENKEVEFETGVNTCTHNTTLNLELYKKFPPDHNLCSDEKDVAIEDEEPEVLDEEPEELGEEAGMIDEEVEGFDEEGEVLDEDLEVLDEEEGLDDDPDEVLDEEPEMLDEEAEMLDEDEEGLDEDAEIMDEEPDVLDEEPEVLDEELEDETDEEPETVEEIKSSVTLQGVACSNSQNESQLTADTSTNGDVLFSDTALQNQNIPESNTVALTLDSTSIIISNAVSLRDVSHNQNLPELSTGDAEKEKVDAISDNLPVQEIVLSNNQNESELNAVTIGPESNDATSSHVTSEKEPHLDIQNIPGLITITIASESGEVTSADTPLDTSIKLATDVSSVHATRNGVNHLPSPGLHIHNEVGDLKDDTVEPKASRGEKRPLPEDSEISMEPELKKLADQPEISEDPSDVDVNIMIKSFVNSSPDHKEDM